MKTNKFNIKNLLLVKLDNTVSERNSFKLILEDFRMEEGA